MAPGRGRRRRTLLTGDGVQAELRDDRSTSRPCRRASSSPGSRPSPPRRPRPGPRRRIGSPEGPRHAHARRGAVSVPALLARRDARRRDARVASLRLVDAPGPVIAEAPARSTRAPCRARSSISRRWPTTTPTAARRRPARDRRLAGRGLRADPARRAARSRRSRRSPRCSRCCSSSRSGWPARSCARPGRSRPRGRASASCTRAPARRRSGTASPAWATTAPSRRPSPGWSRARAATARRSRSCSSTSTSSSGSTTRAATPSATSSSGEVGALINDDDPHDRRRVPRRRRRVRPAPAAHRRRTARCVLARRLLARGLEDRARGDYRAPISFSAGVTACPEFGNTRLELTAQADAALYRGKRAGRTVVTIYDPAKDHGHVDEGMRAELSSAITAVIESGKLTPGLPAHRRARDRAGSPATRASSASRRSRPSPTPARCSTPPRSRAGSTTSIARPSTSCSAARAARRIGVR